MSPTLNSALEHELKGLNEEIARVSLDAQAKHEAAQKFVAEQRAAGVNVLVDDSVAEKAEAMFLEADNLKERISELGRRRQASMGRFSNVVPLDESFLDGMSENAVIAALKAMPDYDRVASAAMGGSALGNFDVGQVADRKKVINALRSGGRGLFASGMYAAGADGDALIPIDQRLSPPLEILTRKIRLLDLITIGATDSDTVRYGKQSVRTSAAATKAVGQAGVGVAYDQGTYTWTSADVSVRSIGHYAKAPRENLADVAALQTLIESQLSEDVLLQAESLCYSGAGTGTDFSGIKTEALNASAYITRDETNERRLSALHRAVTAVRLAFLEPNAIWIHPTDLHNTIVEQSSSGGFLLAAASLAQEQPVLWGIPVVASALATLGEPTVGNFKAGATLWVREGASVRISDSNEDDFIKRMITVLAEFRGGFAVQRPTAFSRIKNFT